MQTILKSNLNPTVKEWIKSEIPEPSSVKLPNEKRNATRAANKMSKPKSAKRTKYFNEVKKFLNRLSIAYFFKG